MIDFLLQTAQILIVLCLVLGWPLYAYWRMKYRVQIAEAKLVETENRHRSFLDALDEVQKQAVDNYITSSHPLKEPPAGVKDNLHEVIRQHPQDPYAFPLGWVTRNGVPDLYTVSLYGDSPYKSGHILLTGETDWGKDGWVFLTAALLCMRTNPTQLRLFWIDGKGPDGALWQRLAHNWMEPVTNADDIGRAVKVLEREREQRSLLLQHHGVTKWEELSVEVRPPLLFVYVSELKLLRRAIGKDLEAWLEAELSSARACGIRYCIATQTATNMKTEWRSQIGLFVAGGQSSRDGDKPNVGIGTDEVRERGGIPPSSLDLPGMFTVRLRRHVVTVRASYLSLDERKSILAQLPPAPSAVDVSIGVSKDVGTENEISPENRKRIEELILEGKSDARVIAIVFNVTGGRRFAPLKEIVANVRMDMDRANVNGSQALVH